VHSRTAGPSDGREHGRWWNDAGAAERCADEFRSANEFDDGAGRRYGSAASAGHDAEDGSREAGAPPIEEQENKLYADLDATNVVTLPAGQRVKKLIEMQPAEFRDFLQHLSRPDRVAMFADLSPEQKETVFALINPQLVVGGELLVDTGAARYLQRAAAGSGDDRLLAEPLQCVFERRANLRRGISRIIRTR